MPMLTRQDKNMMRMPDIRGTEQIAASDLVMEQHTLCREGSCRGRSQSDAHDSKGIESMISRETLSSAAVWALSGFLFASAAIADDGRLRFVSGTGVDKGDCLNKF